jgi:hypothetical protein
MEETIKSQVVVEKEIGETKTEQVLEITTEVKTQISEKQIDDQIMRVTEQIERLQTRLEELQTQKELFK